MSRRISSFSVPSAATESACVWPRVKRAEPCVRGATPTSIEIGRISRSARPSGRRFCLAMRSRMIVFSSRSNASCARWRYSAYVSASGSPLYCSSTASSTAFVASWRASLSSTEVASSSARPWLSAIWRTRSSSTCGASIASFSLPAFSASSRCSGAQLLDLRVGDVERVEHLGLGDLVGARLDHEDGLVGAGDDEVEVGVVDEVGLARVDDEVAVDLADAHGADGRGERDRREHQRRGGAVHREDVVGVDVVDAQRHVHQLRLEVPALREERADRAVDHARGQRALLARATLALEERAGDLARGVHALLDIHRQREEVDVAEVADGRGAEDHRVALADDDRAGGLPGHLAGLERDLAAGDLDRDRGHGVTAHMCCLSRPARRSAGRFVLLLVFRTRPWYRAVPDRPVRSTPSASRSRRRAARRGRRVVTRSARLGRRGGRARSGRGRCRARSQRAHRCGSSRRPWSAYSASVQLPERPWPPAASTACASATARGCLAFSAKWRNVEPDARGLEAVVGRPRTWDRRSRRRTGPRARRRGRGRGRPRAGPGPRRCAGRSSCVKRTDVAWGAMRGPDVHVLRREQRLDAPPEAVFPFFADAAEPRGDHAAAAALPAADTRPVGDGRRHVPAVPRCGIHGVPVRWDTLIQEWEPPPGSSTSRSGGRTGCGTTRTCSSRSTAGARR